MTDEGSLTPLDVRLLGELERTRNVVRASQALGIGRDRAVYRLDRLGRLFGPVTTSTRGGVGGGTTELTPLGRRLLARALGARPGANDWTGSYRRGPPPYVELDEGGRLEVAFRAAEGAPVTVEVDPDALIVAVRPAELSARNALVAIVESVHPRPDGTAIVAARWGRTLVRAEVTVGSVRRLGLAPGRPVILYAKAVSVRRLPSPGRLRS
ncbi:MAG TPA: TOBE domain-containing protein [Thermoplasmata archaeon]|nr:TOBE domain-containing protein [Thermoplasmata archaeon]